MYTRKLRPSNTSFFLFGPRGTGKSTWLRHEFEEAVLYDLLATSEIMRLSRDPSLLYKECGALPPNQWVIIDEVQKVPILLNEVQRLIEDRNLRFVLSGSSARKIKKDSDNLLAGRARRKVLYPLVSSEVGFDLEVEDVLQHGMLPLAFTSPDKKSYLRSYVDAYLQEEIKAEALTRNIGGFARFLEIAARQNGQITNFSSISRDAEVARQTVQSYFDVLKDTLIGDWLPAWKLKRSTKQVVQPKFYLFDQGVARALSGRLPYPPTQEELGPLLETFILNELKAYLDYSGLHYPLQFWSSHYGVEVDFLFETTKGFVAVECKIAKKWKTEFSKGLKRIQNELGGERKVKAFGIYMGERRLAWDTLDILPVLDFLKRLWNGDIVN